MFSVQARQHASNPRNRGVLLDGNAEGISIYPACVDEFTLFLRIRAQHIGEATFEAKGLAGFAGVQTRPHKERVARPLGSSQPTEIVAPAPET